MPQRHANRPRESLTEDEWRQAQERARAIYPGQQLSASGDPEAEYGIRTAIAVADILDNPGLRPWISESELDGAQRQRVIGHGPAHPAGQASRELGRRLRAWREARGWSQRDLAERLGWEQPHVARLEAGVHTPNLATLDRLARRLGLEVSLHVGPTGTTVDVRDARP